MKQLFLFCCLALIAATPVQKPKKVKLPKAYVYIPSGNLTQGENTVSIQGFFMQATEVSNLHYREFLSYLKNNGRTEDYEKAKVYPEGWKLPGAHMDPFVTHYHQHTAFENYPVVNITHEAALLYCEWLGEMLEVKNPEYTFTVRLPLESEWIYAASAGHVGYAYPHGQYLRNCKGQFLYKFRSIGDEAIHRDPETGETEVKKIAALHPGGVGPGLAKSNEPNDFGLYNMSGNVAEMLATVGRTKGGCFNSTGYDIRIDAPDEFEGVTDASPFIGFRPVVTYIEK